VFDTLDVGVPGEDTLTTISWFSLRRGIAIWGARVTGGEECSLIKTYETGCWNVSANLFVSATIGLACAMYFSSSIALFLPPY
jgi:hypothetical protein